MVLGLGVSHQVTVENWFDSKITKPVTQMREYAEIVRAILRGERAARRASTSTPSSSSWATRPRAELPIYIAALSPNMLRLAGEIGDGVMLWLCNPDYIRDVVVPEVTKGREQAGKDARRLRHRRRRARRRSPTTARPPSARCAGAAHLRLAAVLPRDARALGLRRRDSRPSTRAMAAGDVEKRQGGDLRRLSRRADGDRLRGRGPRRASSATATRARPRPASAGSRAPTSRRRSARRPSCYSTASASVVGRLAGIVLRGTSTARLNSATRVPSCL